jgi:hypothetical protein
MDHAALRRDRDRDRGHEQERGEQDQQREAAEDVDRALRAELPPGRDEEPGRQILWRLDRRDEVDDDRPRRVGEVDDDVVVGVRRRQDDRGVRVGCRGLGGLLEVGAG